MTSISSVVQQRYRQNKLDQGLKRIQIWVPDENNKLIQERVKQGALLANNNLAEKKLVKEITQYNRRLLKDIPG